MPAKCLPESSSPENIATEEPDLSATEEFLPTLMSGLQLQPPLISHPRAASTHRVSPPTWGQIKALTSSAQQLVISQQRPCTADNLFVAMLAILTIQVGFLPMTTAQQYWAYIPDPPLLHPTT